MIGKKIIDVAEFAMLAGHNDHLTEDNLRFRMEILSDAMWLKVLHLSRHEAGVAKVRYHSQLWKARYGKSA